MVAYKSYDTTWFSEADIERLLPLLQKAEHEGWRNWVRTKSDYQALLKGCSFDLDKAERFRTFARHVIQVNGKWKKKPFELFPWQWEWVIGPLFGWVKADGTRRHQRAFVTVPKKAGKSALAAVIELYFLMADGESGANCYCAAVDRKQAGLVFGEAAKYVKASPKLNERLRVIPSTKHITYEQASSKLVALSADKDSAEGIDAHLVCYDELHMARSDAMYDILKFAGSARRQPLFLIITTAGDDTLSICYKEYDYAKRILAGEVTDMGYLPCVFEAPQDADPGDPETWRLANPSLGLTVREDELRDAYNQAVATNKVSNFRRRRLNQWVSPFLKSWISRDQWDACVGAFSEEDVADLPCYMGLDLADTDDINALVCVWKDEENERCFVKPYFWVPEDTLQTRTMEGFVPYLQWVQEGWLFAIPGAVTDYEVIGEFVRSKVVNLNLQEFAYDPWNSLMLVNGFEAAGIPTVKVPQVLVHLAPAMKLLERLVLNGELVHDGSPVLAWMLGNVSTYTDMNKNMRPDKKRSKDKIDGLSALVTALTRLCVIREEEGPLWNGTGLLFV